jgi:hypothetical protein
LRKTYELDKYYNSNLEDYNPELVKALRENDTLYNLKEFEKPGKPSEM